MFQYFSNRGCKYSTFEEALVDLPPAVKMVEIVKQLVMVSYQKMACYPHKPDLVYREFFKRMIGMANDLSQRYKNDHNVLMVYSLVRSLDSSMPVNSNISIDKLMDALAYSESFENRLLDLEEGDLAFLEYCSSNMTPDFRDASLLVFDLTHGESDNDDSTLYMEVQRPIYLKNVAFTRKETYDDKTFMGYIDQLDLPNKGVLATTLVGVMANMPYSTDFRYESSTLPVFKAVAALIGRTVLEKATISKQDALAVRDLILRYQYNSREDFDRDRGLCFLVKTLSTALGLSYRTVFKVLFVPKQLTVNEYESIQGTILSSVPVADLRVTVEALDIDEEADDGDDGEDDVPESEDDGDVVADDSGDADGDDGGDEGGAVDGDDDSGGEPSQEMNDGTDTAQEFVIKIAGADTLDDVVFRKSLKRAINDLLSNDSCSDSSRVRLALLKTYWINLWSVETIKSFLTTFIDEKLDI